MREPVLVLLRGAFAPRAVWILPGAARPARSKLPHSKGRRTESVGSSAFVGEGAGGSLRSPEIGRRKPEPESVGCSSEGPGRSHFDAPRRSPRLQRDLGRLPSLQVDRDRFSLLGVGAGVRPPPEDVTAGRHLLKGDPALGVDVPRAAILADGLAPLGLDLHAVTGGPYLAGEVHRDPDAGGPDHRKLDIGLRGLDRQAPGRPAVARLPEPDRAPVPAGTASARKRPRSSVLNWYSSGDYTACPAAGGRCRAGPRRRAGDRHPRR